MSEYDQLQPAAVWKIFGAMAAIPRCSGHEAAVQSIASERLANDRYEYGLDGYLAVLEAQRNAFLAQSEWLLARRQRLDNRINLNLALGGGYPSSATQVASSVSGGSSSR